MREPISEQELKKRIEKIVPLVKGFGLIPDHVVITDENANILYANKGVEQNTGFFVNEIIGKTPGDLWGGKM
ncbi:MAG: PAS domain-containing protein, partial [Candidatus Sungbacteria bacterium]|nr:PAS domain-containing protein [Candidatus Sungbacteria bacterium]